MVSRISLICPPLLIAVLAALLRPPRRFIFDTDPGTDDAHGVDAGVNSPELDVRAITVVAGNVTAEMGLENALRMVSLRTVAIFSRGGWGAGIPFSNSSLLSFGTARMG